jgi:DNA-binding MarR family transcriptional regulator
VAVAYLKSPNFTKLADFVGIDQSTLARNLITVEKQKLVSVKTGKNQREKLITLTKKGEHKVEKSFPLWKKAQGRLVGGIGVGTRHIRSDIQHSGGMGAQEKGGKGLIYEFPGFRLGLPTPTNTGSSK